MDFITGLFSFIGFVLFVAFICVLIVPWASAIILKYIRWVYKITDGWK